MKIEYFNSLTKKPELEKVCGGAALELAYGTGLGRAIFAPLLRLPALSKLMGLWADSPASRKAALRFVKEHRINEAEMLLRLSDFKNFNDFFTRALKPDARPLPQDEDAILFPADARHLAAADVSKESYFYAKNRRFNLEKLFDSADLAKRFDGGALLISRLSPLDYHRFHFPVSGEIEAFKRIGGALNSVSPIALARRLEYLFENKRTLSVINTGRGLCAVIEIGAANVGGIINFAKQGDFAQLGAEKGYFKFGGSCVVSVYERGSVKFAEELLEWSGRGVEYYALANSQSGRFIS